MTQIFLIVIGFFIVGICCGSFCGVLLEDAIIERSFWTGRSQCPSCRKNLHWYELIPLVSYIIQFGKCRACQKAIPTWIFHIEWVMGFVWMIFGTLLVLEGYSLAFVTLHLLLLSFVVILALADLKSFTIPDDLSLPMIFVTTVMLFLMKYYGIETWLLPPAEVAVVGGIVGMLFYCLQIMIPAMLYTR
jgi:leader peptidase (prepilin peptidase) / N-methyltransferase